MCMKNKKKILVISVVGITILLVAVFILLKSKPFSYSNVENNQDYINRQESEFTTGGELSSKSYTTYTSLSLDVEKCSYGRDSVGFGLGRTEFAIEGLKVNDCVFSHGTEIENPRWDGTLDTNCRVPSNISVSLSVTDNGINFSSIKKYCSEI